jgi:hypothetical protein
MTVTLAQYCDFLSRNGLRGAFIFAGDFVRFDDIEGLRSSESPDSPIFKLVENYNPKKEFVFVRFHEGWTCGVMSLQSADRVEIMVDPLVEAEIKKSAMDAKLVSIVNN